MRRTRAVQCVPGGIEPADRGVDQRRDQAHIGTLRFRLSIQNQRVKRSGMRNLA